MASAKVNEGHVSKALLRDVRIAPRKARLIVDLVRGKDVSEAVDLLRNADKKAGPIVEKLVLSAAANAKENSGVDADELFIKSIWVDEGRTLKRFMPRAQGRATPIRKRHSHITVVLDER